MQCDARVYVVDDDPAMRQSLAFLMHSVSIPVETFASADEFLAQFDPALPGCLVLDVRMPGMSGLQLQEALHLRGHSLPIIVVTGYGTIPMAVDAVKAGAFDFLEKPFRDQDVVDRVQAALHRDRETRAELSRKQEAVALVTNLTGREREVLDWVLQGQSNRRIAEHLGLSHKTIEYHRANLMEKMRVQSVPELVQLALLARGNQTPALQSTTDSAC